MPGGGATIVRLWLSTGFPRGRGSGARGGGALFALLHCHMLQGFLPALSVAVDKPSAAAAAPYGGCWEAEGTLYDRRARLWLDDGLPGGVTRGWHGNPKFKMLATHAVQTGMAALRASPDYQPLCALLQRLGACRPEGATSTAFGDSIAAAYRERELEVWPVTAFDAQGTTQGGVLTNEISRGGGG